MARKDLEKILVDNPNYEAALKSLETID